MVLSPALSCIAANIRCISLQAQYSRLYLQSTYDMLWQWQMPGMKMETSITAGAVHENDSLP